MFVANGQASNTVTLNASGEALVEMRVGMQPGDNYRVAVTVFSTNNLSSLQTTNEDTSGFLAADTDKVNGGFNGVLSPLLTVWRKLHLEIDSMPAVPTNGPQANFVSMRVIALKTNYPNAGQMAVYYRASSYPLQTNRYEDGTLTIPGIANYQVIVGQGADYIWQFNNYLNYVVVSGTIPSRAIGATAQLRDDDERWVTLADLPQLPMDDYSQEFINGFTPSKNSKPVFGIASTYTPAFIAVVDANAAGWNTRRTIPFYRNKDVFDVLFSGVFDSAKDVFDNQTFWAHTVTFGFQPEISKDGDPNIEHNLGCLLGVTPETPGSATAHGYSAIYKETIADYAIEYKGTPGQDTVQDQRACYNWLLGVCAHEIGHAPGKHGESNDHAEAKLMRAGAEPISGAKSFSPLTLRRFRTATSWTGGAP